MKIAITEIVTMLLIAVIPACLLCTLVVVCIRALWKYIHSTSQNKTENAIPKSLAQAIKENRQRCNLTQEQVADQLGVSRQAVSKWENGTAEPSTANLLTLAELFGLSVDELLNGMKNQ